MKVLFTSLPHPTHYYPMVPIAWALRTAGHEVRVASQAQLVDTIAGTGLTVVPVEWSLDSPDDLLARIWDEGSAYVQGFDFTASGGVGWTWESLLALENIMVPTLYAALSNDEMVDDLVAFARVWRPDLVLWDPYTLAGAIVAKAAGAAHARIVSGPEVAPLARREFLRLARELPPEHREDPTAEWLGWTLERLGCGPFDEDMVTGQWTIDSTPAGMRGDLGLRTVPVRFVPYHGASSVPAWLREPPARPRVCVTLGAGGSDFGEEPLPMILRGLASLGDIEVVATVNESQREQLGELPDSVRLVDFVPLTDLLPTCSAVVHHGGNGTRSTAELHGVPQLLLTFGWQTEATADRIEAIGAGLQAPLSGLTAEAVAAKVGRLLTEPSFAENAKRLQAEVADMATPNDIVPQLEKLTAEHRYRPV
ncbi:activator-dependent family glycosyltransferase [Spirillospora sp. NPDC029432]|uniref:activator-dependent family glycosyltransferase n=1 Tax=Spirillospora sp. NPDC029432 TaxID=3154599 RepID=UPI00345324BA